MNDYLTEERFNRWEEDEFRPMRDKVSGLPCREASERIGTVSHKVDDIVSEQVNNKNQMVDVEEKVDALIGDHCRLEGKLAILIPLVIASVTIVIGFVIYNVANGGIK